MKAARIIAALILGICNVSSALADEPAARLQRYRKVAKWAVTYDDLELGPVRGVAYVKWPKEDSYPLCYVVLRNPKTNELYEPGGNLVAGKDADPTLITFSFSGSPYGNKVAAPKDPERQLKGKLGDSAKIVSRYGEVEATVDRRETGRWDTFVELVPQLDGSLVGRWRSYASPITQRWHERGTKGDRVGAFKILSDQDVATDHQFVRTMRQPSTSGFSGHYSGFLGQQDGPESWRPLTPRVVAVHVIEDQSAYDLGKPRYPRDGEAYAAKHRHLLVIGRDLPVHETTSYASIETDDKDLVYFVKGLDGAKGLSDDDKQQIAIGLKELTRDMKPEEATEFRKLDVALLDVELRGAVGAGGYRRPEPGPKAFSWGTAEVRWNLQYGDNTADVRFIRIFNETDIDRVEQFALPDKVQIEVETGTTLAADSIPIQLTGNALINGQNGFKPKPIEVIASRVEGKKALYRSPPLLFVNATQPAPPGAIAVTTGSSLLAAVNREKSDFLRASMATAVMSEPDSVLGPTNTWLVWLEQAGRCNNAKFPQADWPSFAKQSAKKFSAWGVGFDLTYGEHAAMLMLRKAFLRTMREQRSELANVSKDDGLVDAWYGRMHDAVTLISRYPLAAAKVVGPAGGDKISFLEVYSADLAEKSFHLSSDPDGNDKYLKWRRQASREAMAWAGNQMDEAIKAAEEIKDCDYEELVKLTGSGFQGISTRLASEMMKLPPGASVTERDMTARAYFGNVDQIAKDLAAVKDFGSKVNTAIVSAALILIPPAAEAAWATAGLAGAEGAGMVAGTVSGFAVFGYDSAHQIYDTYQQYVDVRFAFAASSTIGLERYFDAQSQKTEWWQTGLSIFGQAVLQGIGLKLTIKPMSEGYAAWRGQRIVADLPQTGAKGIYRAGKLAGTVPEVDLASLAKLPADDQYAVAMFLLKEEQQLAKNGLMDDLRQLSNWAFRRLAAQANQTPVKSELPALVRQLEAQAANEFDDLKATVPPPDPLRLVKTDLSETRAGELMREEFLAGCATETPAATLLARKAGKPALDKVNRAWPEVKGADLPKLGVPWKTKINGAEVTFKIESFINQGSFSRVYKLESVPAELGLDPSKRYVLKILMKPEEIAQSGFPAVVPGVEQNIIKRMIKGRDLLRTGKIGQAEFEAYEDAGILIQEYVPFKEQPDKYLFVPRFELSDMANPAGFWANKFGKDKQRAVAELFNKLGDAKIVLLDAHGANIYLEKTGAGWVAKIVDQDFIAEFDKVNEGVYSSFLEMLQNSRGKMAWSTLTPHPEDPLYSTPRSFMQKIMEHQGWLKFDTEQNRYIPWVLDPQEVKKAIPDLMFVEPVPPPPPVKKSQYRSPSRRQLALPTRFLRKGQSLRKAA